MIVYAKDLKPGWRVQSGKFSGVVGAVAPGDGRNLIVTFVAEGKPVVYPKRKVSTSPLQEFELVWTGPVSGVTEIGADNAELIRDHFAPVYLNQLDRDAVVIDVTYGEAGGWWTKYLPPCEFRGSDIKPGPLAVLSNADPRLHYISSGVDARSLPYPDGSVAVALFDPPYTETGTVEKSSRAGFHGRYGLETGTRFATILTDLIIPVVVELARVVALDGVMAIKAADYVSGGHVVYGTDLVRDAVAEIGGWERWDKIVHATHPRGQPTRNPDGSFRIGQRTLNATSELMIFKRVKAKPRPKADANTPGLVGRNHPDTSKVAAWTLHAGDARAKALELIAASDGITVAALAREMDVVAPTLAARVGELRQMGYVERLTDARDGSFVRRTTTPGNSGIVHVATVAGRAELIRLDR